MRRDQILVLAFIALGVAACASGNGPREAGGTAAGAVTGGFIGAALGRGPGGRVAGALAGAALGGFLGNRIRAALDDDDRRRAYEAQIQALETGPSGAPVAWRNPDRDATAMSCPAPLTT